MKILLGLILCVIAVHGREYHYNTPAVGFNQEDVHQNGQTGYTPLPKQSTIIKGNFGPDYEVTMIPSQKVFEQRLQENSPPTVALATNQNIHYTTQAQQQQPGVVTSVNPLNAVNGQQFGPQYSATNQQQNSLITNQFAGLNSNEGNANVGQQLNQFTTINPTQQQPGGVLTSPNPAYYPAAIPGYFQQPNQYSTINSQQYTVAVASANNQLHLTPPPPPLQQPGALISSNPGLFNNNQYSTQNPQQSSLVTNQYPGLNPGQQPAVLTNPNPAYYPANGQLQQPVHQYPTTINPQQSSLITNQYSGLNSNTVAANTQHHLNQYSNQQPQQQHYQTGAISSSYQQQQLNNNNNAAPNSNNLLNDLVNNNKYVSQSEASQLDVYPYKQLAIGNTRPFTRFTTKCNKGVGQCEQQQQNTAGHADFQHQQVLKQSKAKIESISPKCRNNGNYDYSQNSLNSQNNQNSQNSQNSQISMTDEQITAKRNAARKGTYLKDRRLFAYTEQVIPQYPHN